MCSKRSESVWRSWYGVIVVTSSFLLRDPRSICNIRLLLDEATILLALLVMGDSIYEGRLFSLRNIGPASLPSFSKSVGSCFCCPVVNWLTESSLSSLHLAIFNYLWCVWGLYTYLIYLFIYFCQYNIVHKGYTLSNVCIVCNHQWT